MKHCGMNNRGTMASAAIALLACWALPRPAQAAWRAECLSMHSRILGREVGYCALLPPSYDTTQAHRWPVLYYLHGLGDNQQMFLRAGGLVLVQNLWERGRIGEFLIVTPEGNTSFYINSRGGQERYEDFFIREFLVFIERRYRVRAQRPDRGIAGISMGGYGALHLAFRHPELFVSASAESAALIEKLPAVTVENPQQLSARRIFGGVFGTPPDPAFWNSQSPLTLARSFHPAGLKIYFECGREDDYGFDQGAQALHKILTSRGIPHEFQLASGGHNWLYFAERLPASLEFHSHAFGLGPKSN